MEPRGLSMPGKCTTAQIHRRPLRYTLKQRVLLGKNMSMLGFMGKTVYELQQAGSANHTASSFCWAWDCLKLLVSIALNAVHTLGHRIFQLL